MSHSGEPGGECGPRHWEKYGGVQRPAPKGGFCQDEGGHCQVERKLAKKDEETPESIKVATCEMQKLALNSSCLKLG